MNLVATTPITAKAMKSLYAELNRQKDLKKPIEADTGCSCNSN